MLVRDTRGELVPGAVVRPGGLTTGPDGRVVLRFDEGSRHLLRITKDGHAPRVAPVTAFDGLVVPASLARRGAPAAIADARSGGFAAGGDGACVTLPPNALVDAAGGAVTGPVDVFFAPVDVTDERERDAFPGRYEGEGGVGLLAYGCVDITFEQGGRELALAPGATAAIDVPIHVTAHPDGTAIRDGDAIALWSLDEDTGTWRNEGQGTVAVSASSPTGLVLRADVAHFTWWGCAGSVPVRTVLIQADDENSPPAFLFADIAAGNGTGPRSRPFGARAGGSSSSIVLPANLDVRLVAVSLDRCLGAVVLLPAGDPRSVVEIRLAPVREFRPGDRLCGTLSAPGASREHEFEAFRGERFSLAVYPVAPGATQPAPTGDLAGTAVVRGPAGTEIARASFEEGGPGMLETALPADGAYTVEVAAGANTPGSYIGTTAITAPQIEFDLEAVYFLDGELYHVALEGDAADPPRRVNPDLDGRTIRDFSFVKGLGVLYTYSGRFTGSDLHLAESGAATMLNHPDEVTFDAPGVVSFAASPSDPARVVYAVLDGDRRGSIRTVDTGDPGDSRAVSDPAHHAVEFVFARGGRSVVYAHIAPTGKQLFVADLDGTGAPERLDPGVAAGEEIGGFGPVSPVGLDVLYTAGDLVNTRDLYVAGVFDPGSAERLNDPAVHVRVSDPQWFSNGAFVFFRSDDGRSAVRTLYSLQPRNPGDAMRVSGLGHNVERYALSPATSRAAYVTVKAGTVHVVDLLAPGRGTIAPVIEEAGELAFTGDGAGVIVTHNRSVPRSHRTLSLVDADDPSQVVELLPPLPPGGEGVAEGPIALVGRTVVVEADLEVAGEPGLYAISLDRPGVAVRIARPSGRIDRYEVR